MKKNLFTLLFVLFTFSNTAFSQSVPKFLKKGNHYFELHNYNKALDYYEQGLLLEQNNVELLHKIGSSYAKIGQSGKGLDYLEKALGITSHPTRALLFELAEAYHKNYEFDNAIKYYIKWDPSNGKSHQADKLIRECQYGKTLVATPTKAKIVSLKGAINTSYPDYLPQITADGRTMFFTSRRPGSLGNQLAPDGLPFEDVYWAKNQTGTWSKLGQAKKPINSNGHDAIIGISNDGYTMFIYKGSNGGDIYLSNYDGKKWNSPTPLPSYINTPYFESSASLSPDGKTLYYVHSKGASNKNIYVSKKTSSGNWSKPTSLQGINTGYDEESPFIHPDGKTLYFSSKGHNSMGGYDVFKCKKLPNGGWSKPKNLGSPINTPEDDLFFVLTANGKLGYYSSAKKGGKGFQDIYMITMPYVQKNLALLRGKVKDENGASICANITITDNLTHKQFAKLKTDCKTGEYLVALPSGKNYGITIESEGHLFHSENIFLDKNSGFKEFKKVIKIKSIQKNSKIVLKNIFFDSGSDILKDASKTELNHLVKLLKQNPTLKIEISGHTDNRGDATINQSLSQTRAESVVDYLILKKIASKRLLAKGYGSKFPIANNEKKSGRKRNRRTEFKIVSFL